nr:pantetheine-phosphate adenylyltransferase [Candidatus Njordarchaeum guaymaensis]
MRRLKRVGVGGTFDRLHEGHKALLRKAFESGEKVIIGVATENLLQDKSRKEMIYSYGRRVEDIRKFLASEGYLERAEVIPISEPFGTAATDPEMEAVAVSEETKGAVKDINKARRGRKLHPLHLLVVRMVRDKDGKPIKSSSIREREALTTDTH